MRDPHPEDFDPNYASKVAPEAVNLEGIEPIKTREQLEKESQKGKAQSATKGRKKPKQKSTKQTRSGVKENTRSRDRATAGSHDRATVRPRDRATAPRSSRSRPKRRTSFNIYQDQYEDITDIVFFLNKRGVKTDMSQIAIKLWASYIKKKKKELNL